MAKKQASSRKKDSLLDGITEDEFAGHSFLANISGSSWRKIGSVSLGLVGTYHLLSLAGLGGPAGISFVKVTENIFGILKYGASLPLFYGAYYLYVSKLPKLKLLTLTGGTLLLFSVLGLFNAIASRGGENTLYGGLLGKLIAHPLLTYTGYIPSMLFLAGLTFISFILTFDAAPHTLLASKTSSLMGDVKFSNIKDIFRRKKTEEDIAESLDLEEYIEEDAGESSEEDLRASMMKKTEMAHKLEEEKRVQREAVQKQNRERQTQEQADRNAKKSQQKEEQSVFHTESLKDNSKAAKETLELSSDFVAPPLSLLERDGGKPDTLDLKATASKIKRTLHDFGIEVEMDEVSIGPAVTRYALKPAQGTKLSKITSHANELKLSLAVETLRIEAPIPGKSLVGIEVPNITTTRVGLASLFMDKEWRENTKPLLVALGRSVSGAAVFANLAKMPHLLVAGTTGSGKSVTVHGIIASLLYRNSPHDLKFIMVDPKKVELTFYNDIPHLYTPVITNAKHALRTLNWAVNEMERRYDILQANGVQNIDTYHKNVYAPIAKKAKSDDGIDVPERMPYIVIVVDELADLMQAYRKELEPAIVRLAQKSRAVGIHLILSTQRPSVDVITGLIKANIPSRIALKVISQIDSRTMIDTSGAELLLGRGDMLFMSSENPKQERVQAPFFSEDEIKKVVAYLKNKYRAQLFDEIDINSTPAGSASAVFSGDLSSGGDDADDDLYEQAKEIVVSAKRASTSYLQLRLKIGYARAARLINMLEERGVIGPGEGAKPRAILVGSDEVGAGAEEF